MTTTTLTVLTPISHGDGVEGNVTMAKRVTVITSDGPKHVPHLSGNALRGVLRRHGAERMFAMLNVEPGEVPPAAVYAAANGGSLQATKKPLSTRDVHDLRQAVPHLGLFGCSGGGQIIPGSLIVDMPLLRCVERGNSPLSGDKQLVELTGTRHARLPGNLAALASDDDEESNQMIYTFDAIAEGAVFDWGWSIRPGTPDIAESWWTLCLSDWVASGCHVGGRSATGHGRVRLEDRIIDDLARVAKPDLEACTAWHEQHRTEILSWLTRL